MMFMFPGQGSPGLRFSMMNHGAANTSSAAAPKALNTESPQLLFCTLSLTCKALKMPNPIAMMARDPAEPTAKDMFEISLRFMLSTSSKSLREMSPAL
jgi:hypothetical protein